MSWTWTGNHDLHGYRIGTKRTPCGLAVRDGKPLAADEKRTVTSITLRDEWITCTECRKILGLPVQGVAPEFTKEIQ